MRPSQGFRKQAFISKATFWRERGTKTKWETGNIHVLGNRGTRQFISGEQVSPWKGLIYKDLTRQKGVCVRSWCDIQFYANKLTPKSTFIPEFWWARLNQRRLFCADKYPFLLSYLVLCMCGSRGGTGGPDPPPPPGKLQKYRVL